jgi:hypothetical protein
MSQMGQKQTSAWRSLMSAITPKADIDGQSVNVRFVPKADIVPFIRSPRRREYVATAE